MRHLSRTAVRIRALRRARRRPRWLRPLLISVAVAFGLGVAVPAFMIPAP